MNAPQHNDYQAMLTDAARSFLARHTAEHLNDDQRLFNRTVAHLVATFDISQVRAENITGRVIADQGKQAVSTADLLRDAIDFMTRLGTASAQVKCDSCAQYMAGKHNLPLERAQDLAGLAYAQTSPSRYYADMSRSSGQMVMLTDPERGIRYTIPVASIVHHLIDNPARRRISLVQ